MSRRNCFARQVTHKSASCTRATSSIYHEMTSKDKSNHTESNGIQRQANIRVNNSWCRFLLAIWKKKGKEEVKKQDDWPSKSIQPLQDISFWMEKNPQKMEERMKPRKIRSFTPLLCHSDDEQGNHLDHQGNHHLTDHRILANTSALLALDSQINQ